MIKILDFYAMHSSCFSKPGTYIIHNATLWLSDIIEANIRFHVTSYGATTEVRNEQTQPNLPCIFQSRPTWHNGLPIKKKKT